MNSEYYRPCLFVTPTLKSYLENSLAHLDHDLKLEIEAVISNFKLGKDTFIPVPILKQVHSSFGSKKSGLYLNDLMQGSQLQLPKPPTPTRNPELEARIKKLKNLFEKQEYEKMVKNVSSRNEFSAKESIGQEYKQLNKHLITIFNFLLTVVCMFVFAYKATEYALGRSDVAMQLMAGLISATVVFIADIYFIIKTDL